MMKKYLSSLLAAFLVLTALCVPASALDYNFTSPGSGLFAEPTSDNTVYVTVRDDTNIDRSKTAAVIPPRFGSPTSYTLNAGELLTPNLVSQTVTAMPPAVTGSNGTTAYAAVGYTAVTSDLYYKAGHVGTLAIPAIGLSVKVYQGTDNATLAKGAGHFPSTSVWAGNVAIAAHNRGVNNHFGKIHTLAIGDKITYTTQLGIRTYEFYSVAKISVDDVSVLNNSAENIITLVTCVADQPSYRWCVQGKAAA